MLTSLSLIYILYATRQYNNTAVFTRNDIVFSNCKSKSVPVVVMFVTNEIVNVSNIVNCALDIQRSVPFIPRSRFYI